MLVPDDLRYAETHEWIRPEGAIGTVGITDHAQAELTDIVYVELPQVGALVGTATACSCRRIRQSGERHLLAGER